MRKIVECPFSDSKSGDPKIESIILNNNLIRNYNKNILDITIARFGLLY